MAISSFARPVLASVFLVASVGNAWPVDWIHDVDEGKAKFVKLPKVDWFEVDDPLVVSAEWVEAAGELVLIGLKPGRALVLLGADGKVAAWRIRVGGAAQRVAGPVAAGQKDCPSFVSTPNEEVKLSVTIADEGCRKALLALFQTDDFEARSLELTFDSKMLQAQLKSIEQGLANVTKGRVKARYVGAGLILEGPVTRAEHRAVLWELLKRSIGRFTLDDEMVELALATDAGVRFGVRTDGQRAPLP